MPIAARPPASSTVAVVVRALAALALLAPAIPCAALTLMHGYADLTSALLWIQTTRPGPVDVAWTAATEPNDRTLRLETTAAAGNVVVARLTGLVPGAATRYRVAADGEQREGSLAAAPYWDRSEAPKDLTIAFGSCAFLADADPRWGGQDYGGGFEIFDAIARRKPDLMLWLGDNLYFQAPDFLDPSALAARHLRQRSFPPLQNLLTATSHLAIWDDHDFGPNDSDGSYTMKGETLALFKRYWANPGYGLPETPGVFGVARLGDVELFLLDGRYHRSPNRLKDGPRKTMLGAGQLAWLKGALLASTAKIKLIASGSQVLNRVSRFEGWHQFPTEQRALLDFLRDHRIEGVVFLSGDRHFTELLKIDRTDGYPYYEFTSSPLTSGPWEMPEAHERSNPDVVPGTLVGKRQFGTLRVSGPADDRQIEFASVDQNGVELWKHAVRVRDLRYPRARGAP